MSTAKTGPLSAPNSTWELFGPPITMPDIVDPDFPPTATPRAVLGIYGTETDLTSGGYSFGITNQLTLDPSAPVSSYAFGIGSSVLTEESNAQDFGKNSGVSGESMHFGSGAVGEIQGVRGAAYNMGVGIVHEAFGAVSKVKTVGPSSLTEDAFGQFGWVDAAAGCITRAYGSGSQVVIGDANVATAYGNYIYALSFYGNATQVDTDVGLYVEPHVNGNTSLNIWSAGNTTTNRFEGHAEIRANSIVGNLGAVDAPSILGDTQNVYGPLIVNDAFEGDVDNFYVNLGIGVYPQVKNTGTTDNLSFGLYGVDCEPYVPADSTGPFYTLGSFYSVAWNYGQGDITNFLNEFGVVHNGSGDVTYGVGGYFPAHNFGPGRVENLQNIELYSQMTGPVGAYDAIYVFAPSSSVKADVRAVGLNIEDFSGASSVSGASRNIWSQGSTSLNVFEGEVDVAGPFRASNALINLLGLVGVTTPGAPGDLYHDGDGFVKITLP